MGDASSSLPPMDGPMPDDAPIPDAGAPAPNTGMPPMDDAAGELTGKVKEIADEASKLSEKGQDTALKYVRSLNDATENAEQDSQMPGMAGGDPNMGGGQMPPMGGAPMNEAVVFTKSQLRKINENFGEMEAELDRDVKPCKTTKLADKKNKGVTPFDPPTKNIK
jgi:hypothetical protein